MPSMFRPLALGLLALAVLAAPRPAALAAQSVDACYKKCVMDRQLGGRKFACLRICNASPAKKCQDRCSPLQKSQDLRPPSATVQNIKGEYRPHPKGQKQNSDD